MKITFLGTNGFYPTDLGDTICTLIETEKFNLILDAGSGLSKYDKFDYSGKPTFIFLSHLHLDHISGLFTLPKFKFDNKFQIFVSEESQISLLNILNFPYMCPLEMLNFKTDVRKIEEVESGSLPFEFSFLEVVHSVHTLGFRFSVMGKVIAYVTDTGVCDNAMTLAKNADLLILECSHLSNETNKGWPHINPQEAASVPLESGAKRLVLTHFDANRYRTAESRLEALRIVRSNFPDSILANDMMSLNL